MKASIFYRITTVLLLLFFAGHLLGFRDTDPQWGLDAMLASMHSLHFNIQGFTRTYWDFYVGAGFLVGLFYIFAAVLAWQLGGLATATQQQLRGTAWAFAACFAVHTVVAWQYLFLVPVIFSVVITLCLTAAAWLSAKR